ncbi:MAG: PKD domain-containing protein, partial [Prolixibacteraceae bacterium]|nr:PKD domain-containing protein [Prolixibacteraceae bacterium]
MVRFLTFTLLLLFTGNIGLSQENFARNISTSISEDGKLLISYEIAPDNGGGLFSVIMMVTADGKQIKASAAYGDIGSGINPGKEKAIVWYYEDDFDGNIKSVQVNIFAYKENEPVAVFKILSQTNNGYAPSEVTFINNSTFANEYQWNFGDPSSGAANLSFDKDPKHIYQKGGIYSISLTARNTRLNLENTYYQSIEIKQHDPVIADFEIKGNNQLPGAKIGFVNKSVKADTYDWDFGDPASGKKNRSKKENPDFKYKKTGKYDVRLIVKNNFSGLSDTAVRVVTVGEEKAAEAGFIYTKSSETVPSTVVFKNTSENAVRYEWDFGDPDSNRNNKSEESDPAHTYTKPGSYKVELSVWSPGAKKPGKYSENITVDDLPKPPEAKFSIQNNNVLGPATVIFRNNSANADEYLWDFGDPESGSDNSSDKVNPTHTYKNSGKYQVVLTVTGKGFTNKSTATDYVVITGPSAPAVKPVAKFAVEKGDFTVPASVSFKDMSDNADSREWNFGDPGSAGNISDEVNPTHNYTKAGEYKVELKVTNTSSG